MGTAEDPDSAPMLDQEFSNVVKKAVREVLEEVMPKNPAIVSRRWVSIDGAMERLDLTETALRQRMSAGQIPKECYCKMGGSLRFDLQAIDQWMESLKDDDQ